MTISTSDDFSIVFHIGAHKTATTHLQWSIQKSADALAAVGVRYYGPDHLRLPGRSLAALFGMKPRKDPTVQRRPAAAQLALMRKDAHRIVLSEENYIGVLNGRRGHVAKRRYPQAAARITALTRAMGVGDMDVAFGIRHPARFLNSAYGQLLLGGKVMTIEQFKARNRLDCVDWADLVRRIRAAQGVKRLFVWRYEDHAEIFGDICAALVGDQHAGLITPYGRRVHEGLSVDAVAAIQAAQGRRSAKIAATAARRQFPVGAEHVGFDGFTLDEHAAATAHYDAQVAEIAAMPGVTFLASPGA